MGCWKADVIARIKAEIGVTDDPGKLNELADSLIHATWRAASGNAGRVTQIMEATPRTVEVVPRSVEQAEPDAAPV